MRIVCRLLFVVMYPILQILAPSFKRDEQKIWKTNWSISSNMTHIWQNFRSQIS